MKLQDYAAKADFSDAKLAEKVGCSRGYITQLRLGLRKQPSLKLAISIAKATGGKVPVESWGRQ